MAEITKVTTPMIPKENMGNRYKPETDQAFELTDPSKIHKPSQEGKIFDQKNSEGQILRDNMGRAAVLPLLKDTNELVNVLKRMMVLLQTGISTSDVVNTPVVKAMLEELFVPSPERLLQSLLEQDQSAVLFKGDAFDALRDIMAKFDNAPAVREAVANLLKTFEQHVNAQNSIKTILHNCESLLDYMFSQDRQQFSGYLEGLAGMLVLEGELPPGAAGEAGEVENGPPVGGQEGQGAPVDGEENQAPERTGGEAAPPQQAISQKEAAQVLKNNLLPLLGEIVVKYHQNQHIRDYVMVVVHNIVRVDKGTPEALRESVNRLVHELRQLANLPQNFGEGFARALFANAAEVKNHRNSVMENLAGILSETLSSSESAPATIRQAETLLMSLLQNQGSLMNILHFVMPMDTSRGKVFAELYVDPDSQEKSRKSAAGQSRKLFLTFEAESHGAFELGFVQTGEYVDFSMWCPGVLVKSLGGLKRQFSTIMQTYGYTMNGFQIQEFQKPQSIATVFPSLLKRKVGIDVKV